MGPEDFGGEDYPSAFSLVQADLDKAIEGMLRALPPSPSGDPVIDELNTVTVKEILKSQIADEFFHQSPMLSFASTPMKPSPFATYYEAATKALEWVGSLATEAEAVKPAEPKFVDALLVVALEPLTPGTCVVFDGYTVEQDPVTGDTRKVQCVRAGKAVPGAPDGVALSAVDAGHYTYITLGSPLQVPVIGIDLAPGLDWAGFQIFKYGLMFNSPKTHAILTGITE